MKETIKTKKYAPWWLRGVSAMILIALLSLIAGRIVAMSEIASALIFGWIFAEITYVFVRKYGKKGYIPYIISFLFSLAGFLLFVYIYALIPYSWEKIKMRKGLFKVLHIISLIGYVCGYIALVLVFIFIAMLI